MSGSPVNESIFSFRDHFKRSENRKKISLTSRFKQASPHRVKSSFNFATPKKITDFNSVTEEFPPGELKPSTPIATRVAVRTRLGDEAPEIAVPQPQKVVEKTTTLVAPAVSVEKENVVANYRERQHVQRSF